MSISTRKILYKTHRYPIAFGIVHTAAFNWLNYRFNVLASINISLTDCSNIYVASNHDYLKNNNYKIILHRVKRGNWHKTILFTRYGKLTTSLNLMRNIY